MKNEQKIEVGTDESRIKAMKWWHNLSDKQKTSICMSNIPLLRDVFRSPLGSCIR